MRMFTRLSEEPMPHEMRSSRMREENILGMRFGSYDVPTCFVKTKNRQNRPRAVIGLAPRDEFERLTLT